ncbi:MAG: 2-C-methyl-D-erythritol 4-phosphate cytidylyltransferase [bacterium]
MKTIGLIIVTVDSQRPPGAVPLLFRDVAGRPLLSWTVSRFERAASVDEVVIVAAEEFLLHVSQKVVQPYHYAKVSRVIVGGATRFESVRIGLKALPISTGWVAIHDGARPLVNPADIDRTVKQARADRAATLAGPVTDTIKRVQDDHVIATLDHHRLVLAQTPQVFQYDLLMAALVGCDEHNLPFDDAAMVERMGFKVTIVPAGSPNFAVLSATDLILAAALLKGEDQP